MAKMSNLRRLWKSYWKASTKNRRTLVDREPKPYFHCFLMSDVTKDTTKRRTREKKNIFAKREIGLHSLVKAISPVRKITAQNDKIHFNMCTN